MNKNTRYIIISSVFLNSVIYYGAHGRNSDSVSPSIGCPNANDKFTVSSSKGNGKLIYPVALLTADEARLAGLDDHTSNKTSYLCTEYNWWLLSPYSFTTTATEFGVGLSLGSLAVHGTVGVRPSISLAPGTLINAGDGTSNSPYVICENK